MTAPAYRAPTPPLDDRGADLLSRMPLRGKAGRLNRRRYGWHANRRMSRRILFPKRR
ncbi:hypothetical protein AB0M11_06185 [Streptomyces sp. NPDC051987]|uniref:hypothetical protein n=1 Tax=Streptomyces sp. NPDC051987 TaxID=3155808 RepID=UPI00342CCAE9